ncbi:10725_t:CDS:2 [Scutellospora calospora]|uniref:10725_t:CDS:1 n=1 Tax=Scutellospora calospora TaxID=85575 RepID=A0ACA9K8K2_9GLOM|nr:10725_t:CDS:2 [Scutellospora calospora]
MNLIIKLIKEGVESNFEDQTYERAKQEQANYDQNWRNERYERACSSKNIVTQ